MVAVELILASASAVLVPQFAGGLLSRVPGGPIGAAALGAGLIFAGTKVTNGYAKAVLVGTGAGLAVAVLAQMIIRPTVQASA